MAGIMDFADVLRSRKAVRSYLPDPVPRETLERIVARGRKIPSAGHSQGLRLVVVTDAGTRQAIADLAGEPGYVEMGMEPWISRAPAHIVVGVREEDYHDRYREADKLTDDGVEMNWPVPYWFIDAGAAVMLLWLAALDEGLACGVFGTHAWDELRDLLGMPADVTPVAVLTVGLEGNDKVQGSAKRGWKPLDDVVRWERW
jgi:FMN reductase [NAD(P)H]